MVGLGRTRAAVPVPVHVVDPHHPDADPGTDPDPSLQIKAQTLEKVLK